ncbi:LysE family transporter [Acinetobacter baumannii]
MSNRDWYWCRDFSPCVLYTCWYWLLIQQSEWLMSLIRTAGAAYLVYLGWQCLRSQPNLILRLMDKQTVTRRVYLKRLQWVFLPMR